ncbi:MAG: hypothetical protein GIKADHBN_01159 [Phycisphaerales bacterium]|nr:hypothetical protein [Phycisphaerales bacterium]
MHDQPTSFAGRSLLCAVGVAVVSFLGGCSSTPATVDYARPFPRALAKGPTLDIQVFREAQHIEFTNTTARAYGPSTLWLNGRFCRPIDGLAVGETQRYRLKEFRDEYQDPFREGGFFATERPDRLVLAQLETAGDDAQPVMLGLIVVGTGDAE